jgi:hypothetical protein
MRMRGWIRAEKRVNRDRKCIQLVLHHPCPLSASSSVTWRSSFRPLPLTPFPLACSISKDILTHLFLRSIDGLPYLNSYRATAYLHQAYITQGSARGECGASLPPQFHQPSRVSDRSTYARIEEEGLRAATSPPSTRRSTVRYTMRFSPPTDSCAACADVPGEVDAARDAKGCQRWT